MRMYQTLFCVTALSTLLALNGGAKKVTPPPRSPEEIQQLQARVNVLRKQLGLRKVILKDSSSVCLASLALQWMEVTSELKQLKVELATLESMTPRERCLASHHSLTNRTDISPKAIKSISEGILFGAKMDCEVAQSRIDALSKILGKMTPEKFDEKTPKQLKKMEFTLLMGITLVNKQQKKEQEPNTSLHGSTDSRANASSSAP